MVKNNPGFWKTIFKMVLSLNQLLAGNMVFGSDVLPITTHWVPAWCFLNNQNQILIVTCPERKRKNKSKSKWEDAIIRGSPAQQVIGSQEPSSFAADGSRSTELSKMFWFGGLGILGKCRKAKSERSKNTGFGVGQTEHEFQLRMKSLLIVNLGHALPP